MKTTIFIKHFITFLGASLFSLGVMAQGEPFVKEIQRDFTVNKETSLELVNKYGNVDILKGNDNNLSIKVIVKINTRDRARAEEMMKMIQISVSQEGSIIRASTELDEDFGDYFRGVGNQSGSLEINYTVTMPVSVPLNLSNKYGNVFIDELLSTSTIDVKYGKLTANKILHDSNEPLTKIYLSYSNGTLQDTKWIEMDIKYSKINITNSKALVIVSKYSKVYITNGSSVVSESKYDTYDIDKLTNFVTNAAYGHFEIRNLEKKLQVESKYTDFMVERISAGFESIKVDNSYGTYKLGIDPAASYQLDSYSKYCSVDYPENNSSIKYRINENNEQKINARIGSEQNPKALVNITSKYGNIRLVP